MARATAPFKNRYINVDTADIRTKPRNNAENADGQLNREADEDGDDQQDRVADRRSVLGEQVVEDRRNHDYCGETKLAPQTERRVYELSKTVTVLPDSAADRDKADADADVGQDIERALHRVRNREVGVFPLIKVPNEQDPTEEADELNHSLDERELADDAGTMQGPPNHWRRSLAEHRRRNRPEETHR
jgi:hypothetical protein